MPRATSKCLIYVQCLSFCQGVLWKQQIQVQKCNKNTRLVSYKLLEGYANIMKVFVSVNFEIAILSTWTS